MARLPFRRGFTLIELLVVVSVVGLLAALLLPAVQAAREAARRASCMNNLRNIGLGIHNHAEAHGKFPSGGHKFPANSFFVQVLPYIEQKVLHDSINMSRDAVDEANITALSNPPGLYSCPSGGARARPPLIDYAGNLGYPKAWSVDPIEREGGGVFGRRPLAPSEITDGLAATAGVAEWLTADLLPRERVKGLSIYGLRRLYSESDADLEAFVRDCRNLVDVNESLWSSPKGWFWIQGPGLRQTSYNHMMEPNGNSCIAELAMDSATAGSRHGATHVLFMDGGVRAVKATIALPVWRAAGTRAGGETGVSID